MRTQLLLISLTLAAGTAHANKFGEIKKEQPLCFQQEYSSEHMAKHSRQTVKSMKVKVYRGTEEGDEENLYLAVNADILKKGAKETKPYRNGMICSLDDKTSGLNCSVECDGGRAQLRMSTTSGDQIRFINKGFVLYGGCDGEADEDTVFLKPNKGGDDVFLLNKMDDAKACSEIQGW